MGAILLFAAAAGLATFGLLMALPAFSPRRFMVRRLGPVPVVPAQSMRVRRLALRLREVPQTRRLSPAQFRLIQAGAAGAAALLVGAPWLLFGLHLNLVALLLYPAAAWGAPELWLWLQARRRKALLTRTYPDLLAHLVTQTRAGAGTLQAFASSPPVLREPLRSEVEDLIADMRIAPFPAALQRFADRCDVPEVRAFAQNVIYQQSLGIALSEVLESEEAHALAMARQTTRQRIQGSAIAMATVTVILLLNGLAIFLTPLFFDFLQLVGSQ